MNEIYDARRIAAISILVCACTAKADLGEIETETDSGEASGTTMFETTTGGSGSESGDPSETGLETGDNPPMPGIGPAAVDVLFVVDNSGSMGEEQGNVQAAIGALVTALDTTPLDYRIGVTTTDNGNPKCGPTGPEAGNLVFSSCLGRLGDFIFPGADPPVDKQAACTDGCAHENVFVTNGVPWIENDGSNLANGVTVEEALRCIMPQGINGCGFESTLESMHLAIRRSFSESDNEFGFIRPDAHLLIVLVSDETDCSLNKDWGIIFSNDMEGGNEVFWSLPDEPSPTSGVCWNAGVDCSGGPGVYAECHPANKDVEGNLTDDPDASVLYPLSRYQEQIEEIRMSKAASHGQVFLFGILGVPEDYPTTRTVVYSDGEDPSFRADFGIGPGCSSENGNGVPPVRMHTLLEDNALVQSSPIYSICSGGYGAAFTAAVTYIGAYVGP